MKHSAKTSTALKLFAEFGRARSLQAAIYLQQGSYANAAESDPQDACQLCQSMGRR